MNGSESMNVITCGSFSVVGEDVAGFANFPQEIRERPTVHNAIFVRHADIHGDTTDFQTLVHESGHYFGLYHTFEGGCSSEGDGVDDTPREQAGKNYFIQDCSKTYDSCKKNAGLDPIHNFMDYS